MPLEFKPARPVEMFLHLDDGDRTIAVTARRDEDFRTNSTLGGDRYHLVTAEGNTVLAQASIIGTLGDVIDAARDMLADAKVRGPARQTVELNPLRGSVGLPTSPIVSMPAHNMKWK